jgi:hypothetical protein
MPKAVSDSTKADTMVPSANVLGWMRRLVKDVPWTTTSPEYGYYQVYTSHIFEKLIF